MRLLILKVNYLFQSKTDSFSINETLNQLLSEVSLSIMESVLYFSLSRV